LEGGKLTKGAPRQEKKSKKRSTAIKNTVKVRQEREGTWRVGQKPGGERKTSAPFEKKRTQRAKKKKQTP